MYPAKASDLINSTCYNRWEKPNRRETFDEATAVRFGQLVAAVTIVAEPRTGIEVRCYGGSLQQVAALELKLDGTTLELSAPLPVTEGRRVNSSRNVVVSRGRNSIVFGQVMGNINITGDDSVIVSGVLIIDGQAIDVENRPHLVVAVPLGTPLTVGELMGPLGAVGSLGSLALNSGSDIDIHADRAKDLTGSAGSDCRIRLKEVGSINLKADSDCKLRLGTIHGAVTLNTSSDLRFDAIQVDGDVNVTASSDAKVVVDHITGSLVFRGCSDAKVSCGVITDNVTITGSSDTQVMLDEAHGAITLMLGSDNWVNVRGGTSRSLTAALGSDSRLTHHGTVNRVGSIRQGSDSRVVINGERICR